MSPGGGALGAVLLAGGLARRMGGVDKGLVTLGGRTMIERVIDAVDPHVDALVIVANRNAGAYAAFGPPVVPDRLAGHLGPLAGLAAGLHALDTRRAFMCPCDSPFVDPRLAPRLDDACAALGVEVAVAHDGERLQPVFAVVRRETLDSLERFLAAGRRKIDAWYAERAAVEVDCRDLADSFRNINTEAERAAAEAELDGAVAAGAAAGAGDGAGDGAAGGADVRGTVGVADGGEPS